MIILGIDPGSQVTGYGVIEADGRRRRLLEFGVVNARDKNDANLRLLEIHGRIGDLIERHLPDECAVEMPVYGNNPQSMLKLGRAQAAAILAALNRQLPVVQYTPKEVKKSVTGNGAATKEQVRYMVCTLLSMEVDTAMGLDSSDALAIGLCHAHRRGGPRSGGATKTWESFVRENPDRVLVRGSSGKRGRQS